MTSLLGLREEVKRFYYKNEMYVTPALRFVLAMILFLGINGNIGYMPLLNNFFVVLVLSLGCAFLPTIALVLAAAFVSLAQMFAISMEVALIGFCIYLVMYLLFFRLGKNDVIWVLLTLAAFFLGIPYVAPIAVGLLCGPLTILPMVFGVIAFYLLQTIGVCAEAVANEGAAASDLLQATMKAFLSNRAMILVVVVFIIGAVITYVTRRMMIENAWKTAAIVAALAQMVLILAGSLILKAQISIFGLIIGTIFAVVGGFVIEFFRLLLDYKRTEKVQYEDDEYYYYVTAVPKVTVEVAEQPTRRPRSSGARRPQNGARRPAPSGQRRPAGTRTSGARPAGTGAARPAGARPASQARPTGQEPRTAVRSYELPETEGENYTE